MKAIISTKHGPPEVLQLREVEMPAPKEDEILIKVCAATVTRGDVILRNLHPLLAPLMLLFGIKRKRIPGHEFAGDVVEVGKNVTTYQVGTPVFGTTTGLKVGANAEFVCLPEHGKSNVLAVKPEGVSYEEVAALPVGGMTALYILKKGNLQNGQKVLIYGASGSVGTYAVQLAKHFGTVVTAVCSTRNAELVRSLGADHVVDYTQEDFTKSEQKYDVIFDAAGKISAGDCKNVLRENGIFLSVRTSTREDPQDLAFLTQLLAEGKIKVVIDRRFLLEQTAEAHKYVETGRKKGNVIITVALAHEEELEETKV